MSLEEAHQRLDRALESGRAGDMAACKRLVKESLAKAPQTSELWLRAARAFYEFRQYREALTCVKGALSLDDISLENHRMHFELQWRIGRFHEALISAESWLSRERFQPDGFVQVARLLHGFDDHEGALQWGERGLSVAPRSTALHEIVVQSLAILGRQERLAEAVSRWFSSPAVSTEDRLRGIVYLFEAGCDSEASTHLARTASTDPTHAGVLALQARSALWAMELAEAEEKSTQALSHSNEEPVACLVAGGIAVLKGEGALACEHLQGALNDSRTEAEARVWLAEALLLLGDGQAAQEAAQRAVALSDGSLLTAEVVGLLARFQVDALQSANTLDRSVYGAVATKILPLSPDFDVVWEGQVKAVRALLQFALERFGGNRGSALTVVEPEGGSGAFATYDVPIDPYVRGQQIRMLLRTRSAEEVIERLDELVTSFPDHPGGWLVRGHVHRASGNLHEAREDYTKSMSQGVPDCEAKVGLASVLLLSGEKDQALVALEAIVDEGFRAPALKGWLGEIYLALGRLDDAQKYLAEVCEESPNDFRAVLHANLGFLAVGEGDRVSQFVKTLRSRCPGFFFDISEAAGLGSWGREWERTPEALAQFLNTAIQSLRGDRADKVITYFVSGDLMRVAPWTSIPAGTTALPS